MAAAVRWASAAECYRLAARRKIAAMGKLPGGYRVIVGRCWLEAPVLDEFRLERPDGLLVAVFPLKSEYLKAMERAAWRDHCERPGLRGCLQPWSAAPC